MGGDPLTGQAKMIYNSMSSYGYDDQTIADALKTQGLLPTSGTTPPGTTPPGTTPPPGSGGGGSGDGGGDGGASTTTTTEKLMSEKLRDPNFTFDRPTMADVANENVLEKLTSTKIPTMDFAAARKAMTQPGLTDKATVYDPYGIKVEDGRFSYDMNKTSLDDFAKTLDITNRNRGMEVNENFIDRANPTNDSRIVSEEMGLVGGIPDRNRGQTISPQVQEVLSAVNRPTMADIAGRKAGTVDRSISIEDFSKPSNIGDFAITGAPDLTNQTGILEAPPSISMAKDPNVEDPFGGKYTPSFEEKKAVEGILAGLIDKAKGYDIKDALSPESLVTGFAGSKIASVLGIPGAIGSYALNTLKNQSDARKEKRELQAAADARKAKAEREAQQKIKDAEAAQKIKDDAAAKQKIKDDAAQKEKTFREKQKEESDRQKEEVSKQKQDEARKNNEAATRKAAKDLADKIAARNRERRRGGGGGNGGGGNGGGGGSGDNNSPDGGGNYCFDPKTLIQMADGSTKQIKNIQLGDDTKGGEVTGVFQFKASDEIHDYKGVIVAGSHYVKEDGKFIMVKDSPLAVKINKIPVVYSLDTSGRRIFINDIEFADYNGDGVAKNFLTNAGVDLTGFDTEVLRQVEHRLI